MLAGGGDAFEDEEDEEESALAVGSSIQVELGEGSKEVEPEAGAGEEVVMLGSKGLLSPLQARRTSLRIRLLVSSICIYMMIAPL